MIIPQSFIAAVLCIAGCKEPVIEDVALRHQLYECGEEFSKSVQSRLTTTYIVHAKRGAMTQAFKNHAKQIIFASVPPVEQAIAYEKYMSCVESTLSVGEIDFAFGCMNPSEKF